MVGENSSRSTASNGTGSHKTNRRSDSKPKRAKNVNHKIIQDVVLHVRRKLKAFKKSHLVKGSSYNFEQCSECLNNEILPAWKMRPDGIHDFRHFLKLSLRKELPDEVASADEFLDLTAISKRAEEFDALIPECNGQILNCLEKYVVKTCISLKQMTGKEVLLCVEDYENNIVKHKGDIESKWEEIQTSQKEYDQMLKPFVEFIQEGSRHTEAMSRLSDLYLELCRLIENWLREDEEFPNKVEEEIEVNRKLKENLKESLVQLENKKQENAQHIAKLQKKENKATQHYYTHRTKKHRLKTKLGYLENKGERTDKKIQTKRAERDGVSETDAKTQREKEEVRESLASLDADIEKLEKEKVEVEKQTETLKKQLKTEIDRTYEYKVESVTCRHDREDIHKENRKLDSDMSSVKERISEIEQQILVLMKIREMKISDDAFRRNIRDKERQDAALSNGSLHLSEACQFAAPSIGRDWKKVYLCLPFTPLREQAKRQHDIDLLDDIGARRDIPEGELALKSLGKWQMFHRRGTVSDLVLALKDSRKSQLAQDVEKKFGASGTA
ncbi:uncharacterized protein LOC131936300 isoform X1 [Physella acuta]|uniref:uncharacterized protein LOC131936300 isoform X1 n=1 Tax=Physella acuta TaxID=109671 RepID=UPI0027DD4A4E|nr:uncharacterized protein LOC131936300 isoform X1 [Physella acuta]XP_059149205.1 uncharacterized protein LOC131936300 isoform X1 [Physella acuta]XP_059149206.1 uncharacterized protein LOC131936300 isoform X1 [Physella acuta]